MNIADGLQSLRGKRVFVTGHTGFKGSWLLLLLDRLGCRVTGYSLEPPTSPSLFEAARLVDLVATHHVADIRDTARLSDAVRQAEPDVVLHLAARPLVRLSHREPLDTFSTNVVGTASLLDAVRTSGKPARWLLSPATSATSPTPTAGHTTRPTGSVATIPTAPARGRPNLWYPPTAGAFSLRADSASMVFSWRPSAPGNVIGGGDWAADRIVTDIVRHLAAGEPVPVRNPAAVRPWQHVLEPLAGYLSLAAAMLAEPATDWCTGWNFGPAAEDDITVQQLTEIFIDAWGVGCWEDRHDPRAPIETHVLRLAIDKSLAALPWRPRFSSWEAIQRTAAWFRAFEADSAAARSLCLADIEAYEQAEEPDRTTRSGTNA